MDDSVNNINSKEPANEPDKPVDSIFTDGNIQNQPNQPTDGQKPKKKHRFIGMLLAILAVILFSVGTAAGVWYWQNGEQNKQRADSDTRIAAMQKQVDELKNSQKDTKSTASANKTVNWKTYTNNQDGFQLTFPENWKGYGISESLDNDKVTKYIYFGLPLKNTNASVDLGFEKNYANIFALSVISETKWEAEKDQPGAGIKIAEKGDKVYTYARSNGIIDELQNTSAEKAVKDIESIIGTFKTLN